LGERGESNSRAWIRRYVDNLVNTILPQVKEYGLIAIGSDPIGDIHVEVLSNGQRHLARGSGRENNKHSRSRPRGNISGAQL
jgi:hypothetical protein